LVGGVGMNDNQSMIIKKLTQAIDFVINNGSPKLISLLKPILTSLLNDSTNNYFNKLQNDDYENLLKFLESLENKAHINSSDEKKLIYFANIILDKSTKNHHLEDKKLSLLDQDNKTYEEIKNILQKKYLKLQLNTENYEKKANDIIDDLEKYKINNIQKIDTLTKEMEKIKNYATSAKKAFDEEHKLHEAKNYWYEKAKRHNKIARNISLLFFIILFSLPTYIYFTGEIPKFVKLSSVYPALIQVENNKTLSPYQNLIHEQNIKKQNTKLIQEKESNKNSIKDPQFRALISNYALYFFMVSIIIWLSRILLKIIFSNLHLKEEAHEKETQILTYLALIKEDAGLEENDRKLILEAIFRPSTNGLIKDESNVTLLDIANIFKGK
jgi:hypothetical protein